MSTATAIGSKMKTSLVKKATEHRRVIHQHKHPLVSKAKYDWEMAEDEVAKRHGLSGGLLAFSALGTTDIPSYSLDEETEHHLKRAFRMIH
jgi:hypothetical protein